mmetsp:Transcript_8780/g.21874  ORF Transcript_8780/g.21874 Transcript_8780/m.21874 type:complete len:218 (+) Transcript_8780:273-926(+)
MASAGSSPKLPASARALPHGSYRPLAVTLPRAAPTPSSTTYGTRRPRHPTTSSSSSSAARLGSRSRAASRVSKIARAAAASCAAYDFMRGLILSARQWEAFAVTAVDLILAMRRLRTISERSASVKPGEPSVGMRYCMLRKRMYRFRSTMPLKRSRASLGLWPSQNLHSATTSPPMPTPSFTIAGLSMSSTSASGGAAPRLRNLSIHSSRTASGTAT